MDYEAGLLRERLSESPSVAQVTLVADGSPLSPPEKADPPRGVGAVTSATSATETEMQASVTSATKQGEETTE